MEQAKQEPIFKIKCQKCQSPMVQTTCTEPNTGMRSLLGVVFFITGIPLLLLAPFSNGIEWDAVYLLAWGKIEISGMGLIILGTIIGFFLVVCGSNMCNSKRKNVWKCNRCGYFFERM